MVYGQETIYLVSTLMRILRLRLYGLYNKSRILKVDILNIDTFTPTEEGQDKTVGLKGKNKVNNQTWKDYHLLLAEFCLGDVLGWISSCLALLWGEAICGAFRRPASLPFCGTIQTTTTYLFSDDPTNQEKILWTWCVQGNDLQTVWCIMGSWLVQSCYRPTESWSSTRFAKLCLHHLVLGR